MASYKSFKRIDNAAIVDKSIQTADIGNASITSGKLNTDSVTTAKIADGAVGASQLASTLDISAKAVTYRTLTTGDFSDSAGLTSNKFATNAVSVSLGYTPLTKGGPGVNSTITGTLKAYEGDNTAPGRQNSVNFSGSLGFWFPAADTIAFRAQGATSDYFRITSAGHKHNMNNTPMWKGMPTAGWVYANSFGGSSWRELTGGLNWGIYGRNISNSAGRITVPVSGFYSMNWSTYQGNNSGGTSGYTHFTFTRNGSTGAWSGRTPHGIFGHGAWSFYVNGVDADLTLYLTTGQFTSVMYYWNNFESRIHGAHSHFGGHLAG